MNERIADLYEKASEWALESDSPKSYKDRVMSKFAELMVQDCIRILHSNGYDDAAKCLQDIHFGIENPV